MPKSPLFWLGLLFGTAAGFAARYSRPRPQPLPHWLELTEDAFAACDLSGAVTQANDAARTLFGPHVSDFSRLCYLSGQPVPPGQCPLTRARREPPFDAEYRHTDHLGIERVLRVSARRQPRGGAAAVFRDVTALHTAVNHAKSRQAERDTLHRLGVRLGKAETLDAVAQAVAEEALALFGSPIGMQAQVWTHDPAAQTLTRRASVPEPRAKRTQSAPPAVLPFAAADPALWQLYIARQPVLSAGAYALPLLSSGLAIGHLQLSSSDSDAFSDAFKDLDLCQALHLLTLTAAPALAGPTAAGQAADAAAHLGAVREIAQAVAADTELGQLADSVSQAVRRLTRADVCVVSVPLGKSLAALGTAYKDDLLFPDRFAPNSPALHGKAAPKAWRTQKSIAYLGLPNPDFEKGVWRAFAGNTGRHSVLALPIAGKRGVLTVYISGDMPLPEAQVRFLETLTALLSSAMAQAILPEDRADE